MDINATLLGQIITFALLVWFTMKFIWPPLMNMLDERGKRIADGLAAAEKGKQELLDAEERVAEELRHVQNRATEIMSNAEKRGEQIIEESKQRATIEGDKILIDARSQIEQEFMRAKEQLRIQVAALAVKGAEQILKSEIDASRHDKILSALKAEF